MTLFKELSLKELDQLLMDERKRALSHWPYTPDQAVRNIEDEIKRRGEQLPEDRQEGKT